MKDKRKYKILCHYYYNINILLWWIKSFNNFIIMNWKIII